MPNQRLVSLPHFFKERANVIFGVGDLEAVVRVVGAKLVTNNKKASDVPEKSCGIVKTYRIDCPRHVLVREIVFPPLHEKASDVHFGERHAWMGESKMLDENVPALLKTVHSFMDFFPLLKHEPARADGASVKPLVILFSLARLLQIKGL